MNPEATGPYGRRAVCLADAGRLAPASSLVFREVRS